MERTALRGRPLGSPTPASGAVSDSKSKIGTRYQRARKSGAKNDRPSYPDGRDPWSLITGAEPFPQAFRPTKKVMQTEGALASRESTQAEQLDSPMS
jgi:hypothetical protein